MRAWYAPSRSSACTIQAVLPVDPIKRFSRNNVRPSCVFFAKVGPSCSIEFNTLYHVARSKLFLTGTEFIVPNITRVWIGSGVYLSVPMKAWKSLES
jgi:hypothetical protein